MTEIHSSVEIATRYLTPITTTKDMSVRATVNAHTIRFSNVSNCAALTITNEKAATNAHRYSYMVETDVHNFAKIAQTFAALDAKQAQATYGG